MNEAKKMGNSKYHLAISFIINAFTSIRDWLLKDSLKQCKIEIEKSIKTSEALICKKIDALQKESHDNNLKILEIVSNMMHS